MAINSILEEKFQIGIVKPTDNIHLSQADCCGTPIIGSGATGQHGPPLSSQCLVVKDQDTLIEQSCLITF